MSKRNRHRRAFETKNQPILPRPAFALRVGRYFLASLALILGSLFLGMLGYHFLEDLPWIDAFVNASMILAGMGPVAPIQSWCGKLFAGCYALYSGLLVILASGLLLAPFVHRLLHQFQLDSDKDN